MEHETAFIFSRINVPFDAGISLHTLNITYPAYLDQKDKDKNSQFVLYVR